MNRIYILLICILTGCSNPMQKVTRSKDPLIKKVINNASNHEIQIIYTQIDTSETGGFTFKDYSYKVDENNYFYPASTVKLPMAIFAAEYLENLDSITLDIPYVIVNESLKHSVGDDIAKIFAVSDNSAYNRLYDLVGRDYVNKRFRESGLSPSRISHRLDTTNADIANHKEFIFFPGYTEKPISLIQKDDSPVDKLKMKNALKGKGYQEEGRLINKPMDFSTKNYFPLAAQHSLMKRLVFPENFLENERFKIQEDTRLRLLDMMQTLPKEAGYSQEYADTYVKFFMYGDSEEAIPDHIEIYNKVGYAYGTVTETAYIKDVRNKVHFFLSATILVNKNGIYNDDAYEYDEIAIPFLAQLGREFYELELDRKD